VAGEFRLIRDRKIRVGVIGCGRISDKHFEAIEKLNDDLEIVDVCDTDIDALQSARSRFDSRGFDNFADLLSTAMRDVVALCTPSGLHPTQAIQAAQAGCHVETEKPMAARWADGKRMVEECDKAHVRLFVVKQNRRNATLQLLKKAVERKGFG
jgi:UDP-N-acetyl-2-amino-2-deoxyglucuronate dehydrogenase